MLIFIFVNFIQFLLFFDVLTKNLRKLAFLPVFLLILSTKSALSCLKSHINCFNEPQNDWCGLTKSNNVKRLVKKETKNWLKLKFSKCSEYQRDLGKLGGNYKRRLRWNAIPSKSDSVEMPETVFRVIIWKNFNKV